MIVRISRVYNILGQSIKSELPEDITEIQCSKVALDKNRLILFDNDGNTFFGEIIIDSMNYEYSILEE